MIRKLVAVGLVVAIGLTATACQTQSDGDVDHALDVEPRPAEQPEQANDSSTNDTVDDIVGTNDTVDIGEMI